MNAIIDPEILLIDADPARRAEIEAALKARGLSLRSCGGMPASSSAEGVAAVLIALESATPELLGSLRGIDPLLPLLVHAGRRPGSEAAAALGRARVRDVVLWRGEASGDDIAARLREAVDLRVRRRRPPAVAEDILGTSDAVAQVRRYISVAAASEANVLILGESGTGKELVARAIHRHSARKDQPFVAVNCSAIPDSLLESQLFGHEKGSFTGAVARTRGLFDQADGGTLFLDEIGDMPVILQAKLLRILQPPPGAHDTTREFARVGGEAPVRADVRLLFATHRDLAALARDGRFREDLLQRLDVLQVRMPALRDRREDVPLLANIFLARHAQAEGRPVCEFDPLVMDVLTAHSWPLNVRELEAAVRSIVILKETGQSVVLGDLPPHLFADEVGAAAGPGVEFSTLAEVERAHVDRVMAHVGGNKSRAARILGISRPALDRKLDRKLDVSRIDARTDADSA